MADQEAQSGIRPAQVEPVRTLFLRKPCMFIFACHRSIFATGSSKNKQRSRVSFIHVAQTLRSAESKLKMEETRKGRDPSLGTDRHSADVWTGHQTYRIHRERRALVSARLCNECEKCGSRTTTECPNVSPSAICKNTSSCNHGDLKENVSNESIMTET